MIQVRYVLINKINLKFVIFYVQEVILIIIKIYLKDILKNNLIKKI